MTEDELIAVQLALWREDPCSFVRDNFGVEPDKWQAEALIAFVNPDRKKRRIVLSACAGPGKSTVLAWCALLFISCYMGEKKPVGYVVSETRDLLRDTLWKEISIWMGKSELLSSSFTITNEKLYNNLYPMEWFLAAKTYAKTANEDEKGKTLSGQHSTHIAYFIDEAGDMSIQVLKGAEQGMTNCVFGKIIMAGNPTSHTGLLYYVVEEVPERWHVINITGDPDDPMRSPRIDIEDAREAIEEYGRDDAWVMAYILGKFPLTSIDTLLSPDEVRAAIKRGQASELTSILYEHSQRRLGVDIALYGSDLTIIFPRQGLRAFKPVEMRNTASEPDGQAPARIAARIMDAKNTWKSEMEFIDCTGGYGDGVVQLMIDAGADPVRVVYSSDASDKRKYYNKRTENWFRMRDWIRRGGILPNVRSLIKGLSAPTYTMKKGRLLLEPTESIKTKIKRSPDQEMALSQTFAFPEMQADFSKLIPGLISAEVERQGSDWEISDI